MSCAARPQPYPTLAAPTLSAPLAALYGDLKKEGRPALPRKKGKKKRGQHGQAFSRASG